MNQQPPRRRARAIAISETIEARRKAMLMKALTTLGLGVGVADAIWTMHHLFIAR